MTGPAPVVIGVDVGSTSARAGVFDANGRRLARAEHGFAVNRPQTDHAEHSSAEIWRAVCEAVRDAVKSAGVAPESVAGLAFDATCSLVLLDAKGEPVTVSTTGDDAWNVVMWADHRAVTEAEEITATRHRVLDYVGGVMSPEMELPKLLWLKRHLAAAWSRYALALDLADFLTFKASGNVVASACTLTCKWTYLNHEREGWQQDLLDRIGLGDLLQHCNVPAKAMPIGAPAGVLTAQAASDLGLSTTCVVGVGLIDAHAGGVGLLGHLAREELDANIAMIAGTSTCHMAASVQQRPIKGVWGPYYGAMLPELWLNEAGQSATGALLDHVLDLHAEGRNLGSARHQRVQARLQEMLATEGPELVGDLQVVPDFHGNRSPLANPSATGAIAGLTLDHSFDALARLYYATALGIALGTRHIIEALDRAGYAIRTIHLTGGHITNPLLVGLYADAAGREVSIPQEEDSVLLGTAAVAAAAASVHPSLNAAARAMIRQGRAIRPVPGTAKFFDRQYRRFLLMLDQQDALRRV